MSQPRLWVLAGPNGAGKSTFVERYLRGRLPVVNPDILAFGPGGIGVLNAGRVAIKERRRRLTERQSFLIETTLTGRGEVEFINRAIEAGFRLTLGFVGVGDVQLSVARVGARVRRGGHDVPTDDLLRRYERSMANLRAIAGLADRAYLIDNSGKRRRLLRKLRSGAETFRTADLPAWADF